MQAERLPALVEAATYEPLRALLRNEVHRVKNQRDRLDALGEIANGPANLWMRGILDDADRDARSHQPGAVLDIALVGVIRKAKAAEIVSTETALALAHGAAPRMVAPLQANHEDEIAGDVALKRCLRELTNQAIA